MIIPDMFANAGGVTVSYFEWVKNINQIRFGRLQRRYEEGRNRGLIEALEKQGIKFSRSFTLREKPELEDLRTAAFYTAINDIALHYRSIGL